MKTKPVYSKSSPFRIAYVANGRWQLQYRRGDGKGDRDRDPWEHYARPTDFDTAKTQLAAHDTKGTDA